MVSSRAFPSEPLKRRQLWDLAAAILKPSPKLPPDEWARANRVYPETSGLPGPRDPSLTPYVIPVVRAVHAGLHKRVVLVCGAQMGKTDGLLDVLGARLDQRPAPILYVGPIRDFLTDQFEPRLMSLLDARMLACITGARIICII